MQVNINVYLLEGNVLTTLEKLYDENREKMNDLGFNFIGGYGDVAKLVLKDGVEPYRMEKFLREKLGNKVKVDIA